MGRPQTLAWLGSAETDAAENATIARYHRRRLTLWRRLRLAICVLTGRQSVPDASRRPHL